MIRADILEDSTGVEIAKANDMHSIGFMKRDYTQLPDELEPRTETHDGYFLFHSKVDYPVMNAIMCLDADADFPDEKVKDIVDFYRRKDYPQLWWLGELSTPPNVADALIDRGLKRIEWEIPMMAADLTEMDFSELDNLMESKKLLVKRVSSNDDLTKWLAVIKEVYQYPDVMIEALRYIFQARLKDGHSSLVQNFLAEIKGRPVGASSLTLCEGLAGLYYVGTIKDFRGQRVGSAVTLAAMKEGRNRGYAVGILGASNLGFSVYQRVGFREYYKLHLYTE